MSIQIQTKISSEITYISSKIINDWCKKINQQCNDSLPVFKVFITEHKQQVTNTQSVDLVLLLSSNFTSPHLLAVSSQLSTFGQRQKYFVPAHLAQIAIANCIAITAIQYYLDLIKTGQAKTKSKIHLLDYADCLRYFGAFNITAKAQGLMENRRSQNILDGGAPFYAIYPTKQGFLAVGNLQPKFFKQMVEQMGLQEEDRQFCLENQINTDSWPKMRSIFSNKFMQRSAQEWQQKMKKRDTCVTAVKKFQKISLDFLHPNLIKPKF